MAMGFWLSAIGEQESHPQHLCQSVAKDSWLSAIGCRLLGDQLVQFRAKNSLRVLCMPRGFSSSCPSWISI